MLPGVRAAAFVVAGKDVALCRWPRERPPAEALVAAARFAAMRGAPVDSPVSPGDDDAILAHPVTVNGRLLGAIALALPASAGQHAVVHQLLDWSEAWLELLLRRRAPTSQAEDGELETLIEQLPITDRPDDFLAAFLALLLERIPSDRLWCVRVQDGRAEYLAASDASGARPGVALDGMVEEACLEGAVRGATVRFQAGSAAEAELAAHEVLAREAGTPCLLTLPLPLDEATTFVLLLARTDPRGFTVRESAALEQLLRRLGPLLRLQRALRPGPLGRVERAGSGLVDRLARPGFTRLRVALALVLLLGAALVLGEGRHEIRADAFIEGRVQQAIAAPFDGYVAEAAVRAGERVEAGQTVARLDDEALLIERQEIDGELAALDREYRQALAAVDQAQTRIFQARIAQARARRGLLETRLALLELKAPVDGVVISGDLSRAIGTPVSKGQLLFEIAPLDAYRVVARVAEADVDEVRAGQLGELVLSAFPGDRLPFAVERVSSVFEDDEREGVSFRVEGAFEADPERLRPGMEGTARIDAGTRSLWWIYTHELGDWLRLLAWRWLP